MQMQANEMQTEQSQINREIPSSWRSHPKVSLLQLLDPSYCGSVHLDLSERVCLVDTLLSNLGAICSEIGRVWTRGDLKATTLSV